MILKSFFFLLFATFIFYPTAGTAQWQRTSGPEGGAIAAIVSDGDILYAATGAPASSGQTSAGDIYRSGDLGLTWVSIGARIPGNSPVYCLGINTKAIYAGTHSGLYRKMKTDVMWDSISPSLTEDRVEQILVTDTDIIAYTGFNGIYRSTDDGKTWKKFNLGNLKNANINAIDRIGSTIFLASQGQGVYISSDNGITWAVKNDKISGDDLYVRCLHHLNGIEFAGTLRGAYSTMDFGNQWDSCRTGLPSEFGPDAFVSEGLNTFTIYANVSSMGVFYSTDFGASWHSMSTGLPQYAPSSALALCSGKIFSGVSPIGVMRAPTDTKVWENATVGISNTSVGGMLQFPGSGNGNIMFAGASDNDFGLGWRSSDKGTTWQAIDSLTNVGVNCFGIKDSILFAGTAGGGMFTSGDGGVKWKSVSSQIPGASYISNIGSSPSAIVAAISGNVGVIRSTDLGATWTTPLESASANINCVFYDSLTHTLFAGSNFGFFTSQDDAVTWNRPKTTIDSSTIYCIARSGNTLLAGSWFGIYHSTDNGATWSLADPVTAKVKFLALLAIGGDVYAAIHGDVLVSHDKGSHWQSFQTGIPGNTNVASLSSEGINLYAGTIGYGVLKTTLPATNAVHDYSSIAKNLQTIYSGTQPVLRYSLSSTEHLSLKLISVTGENLLTLYDGYQSEGIHEFQLNDAITSRIAAGIYFAQLHSGETRQSSKVLIRK